MCERKKATFVFVRHKKYKKLIVFFNKKERKADNFFPLIYLSISVYRPFCFIHAFVRKEGNVAFLWIRSFAFFLYFFYPLSAAILKDGVHFKHPLISYKYLNIVPLHRFLVPVFEINMVFIPLSVFKLFLEPLLWFTIFFNILLESSLSRYSLFDLWIFHRFFF